MGMEMRPRTCKLLPTLPTQAEELTLKTERFFQLAATHRGRHNLDITTSKAIHELQTTAKAMQPHRPIRNRMLTLKDEIIIGRPKKQRQKKKEPPTNTNVVVMRRPA